MKAIEELKRLHCLHNCILKKYNTGQILRAYKAKVLLYQEEINTQGNSRSTVEKDLKKLRKVFGADITFNRFTRCYQYAEEFNFFEELKTLIG